MVPEKSRDLKSKVAAGATVVALSGLVPTPMVSEAQAATTTFSVVGSFSFGIMFTAKFNLNAGTLIATGSTGKLQLTAGGATAKTNGVFFGANTVGTVKISAKVTTPVLNVTVTGLGPVAGPAPGIVKISQLSFTGGFTATFKTATTKALGIAFTTANAVNVGMAASWSGGRPIGAFTHPIKIVVAF